MKYGPLGRSGLIVSRICLGGNSWGAKGRRGWGKFDEAEAPAYFRRALDVGINFFDTADAYNFGRSEEIMGATLLKMVRRDEVVISTKVGVRMSDGPNDVGTGRKHLMSAVDAQLKRLLDPANAFLHAKAPVGNAPQTGDNGRKLEMEGCVAGRHGRIAGGVDGSWAGRFCSRGALSVRASSPCATMA